MCWSAAVELVEVEKDAVCAGSSYGKAGLIVPSYSVPSAEPGVRAEGLRWMFDPDSPGYIKGGRDRDLVAWPWLFRKAMHLESLRLYEVLAAE